MKLWWLVLVGFVFWGCSNGNTPQQDGSSNSTEAGQEMVEETSSGSDAGQDVGQPGESAQEASAVSPGATEDPKRIVCVRKHLAPNTPT